MPKRMVTGPGPASDQPAVAVLPTWQATGLCLAVIATELYMGSGALAFGVLAVGVIWALHRLHANAPRSRSTADLIASVPGAAPALAVGVIQFAAYVLLGAYVAKNIGLFALAWSSDPVAAADGWWWPALAVAATAVAAALVVALPTRLLAPAVTVLAAFSLLVLFYVALAVMARVASGRAPIDLGPSQQSTELAPAAVVIALAIGLVGFEIPTAVSDRLKSVSRPLGWAIALVAGCAATAWLAANMGTQGDFRYDAADLVFAVGEMFGETGSLWMLAAAIAAATSALLVLIWGAARVAHRQVGRGGLGLAVTAVLMALLTLAMCRGWGDVAAKLSGVAAILLMIVYVAVAHANSRLDDANTVAWALVAAMSVALAAVVAVILAGLGDDMDWWPVTIAAVIVGVAAIVAFRRYPADGSALPKPPTQPPR